MLVSAKQSLVTLLPKRPGDEPSADAAAGLQGGMQAVIAQALQNNVQAQTTQATTQVQESATQSATQQVSEAAKVSDNVEEAFAKTRVNLQAVYAPLPEGIKESIGTKGSATDQFKDYMSKTPEERLRDAILDEMGLTQEEIDQMPPEKQMAIGEEIAQRIQDKAEIAKAEKEHENGDQNKLQVVDKFLAAL